MDKIAVLNDEHNAIERAALGRTQELEAERDGLLRKLDDLATLEAGKRALEGRVSDRDAEIARVQSDLAETKSLLEYERDALQGELFRVQSAMRAAESSESSGGPSPLDPAPARVWATFQP